MRIIAGTKRGMKLLSPKTFDTRPITDRVKESLFSILYKYDLPEERIVADLFAGTGSLGLEALSRGAKFVTFVEQSPKVATILNRNIEKAGFVAESKVIRANVFKIGAPVDFDRAKYDLVFVDPPYVMTNDTSIDSRLGKLLTMLCDQLAGGAIVCVRTHKNAILLDRYADLKLIERRQWGNMAVTLLQFEGLDNDEQ